MPCEIFKSANSTHYMNAIGHVADDGNIYDTALGSSESYDHCVGHIGTDGNVYTTARGFGEGTGNCVGHIGSNNDIYANSKFQGDVPGYCVGHVEHDGKVYTTPSGTASGYCVGQVSGGELTHGAAALLLLLKAGKASDGDTSSYQGMKSYGGGGGGGSGFSGGSVDESGRRPLPPTIYNTEGELIKAFITRIIWLSALGSLLGILIANMDIALGVLMGVLAGVGLSLMLVFGFTSRTIYRFDTAHCKHGWLGVMLRRSTFVGFTLPSLMMIVAALIAVTCLTGTASLAISAVYIALIIGASLALGKAIRRRRSK